MSTVLCPHLVALEPSSCTSISCRASHNHSPAFCDPCKAVYAEVHTEVHLGSSKHRLRVEGPIAPVRCVVCAPLGAEPPAQYLFVGPEHYAVHARTSTHRTKLAKFPVTSLAKPTRSKTDSGIGLGRPGIPGSGDARTFAMERPYAPRASAAPHLDLTSPPSSRGVTPAPGSRPASSMSFGAGEAHSAPPPGPPPLALGPSEYVLCALCHVVLPVPPVDVAHKHGSTDSRLRIASGSDVTVRGTKNDNDKNDKIMNAIQDKFANDEHDDDTTTVSVLTTTENEADARKSLVLANHDAHDKEHARRVRFPKFRSAWDKRARKEKEKEGPRSEGGEERLAITERGEEGERPPEEQEEREAEPEDPNLDVEDPSRFATADTSILTMSPSQLTLSSLSASPSVAVLGLDDEGGAQYTGEDEEGYPEEERYEGSYEGREYGQPLTAVEEEDERSQVSRRSRAYAQSSSASSSPSESVVELGGGYAGIRVPAHLLPFLSPLTPATQLEASPTPSPESPETPLPAALARVAPFAFAPPPPALPQNRAATSYAPPTRQPAPTYPAPTNYLFASNQTTPSRGRTLEVPRPRPSPSVSARSQPYEPSPSPPPRLAFDDHGRVIKLGMRGWEIQDPEEEVAKTFSARSRSTSAKDESERDEEEKDEREADSEGEGAPPVVSSLSIKRYPIGRNGTIMPPRPDPRPELRPAASAPAVGLQGPAWERGPLRDSLPSFPSNTRRASGPVTTSLAASLGVGLGIGEERRTEGQRSASGGASRAPQRANTIGTQRNVSGSSTSTVRDEAIYAAVPARAPAPKAPVRGATTTATRPVAARRSTSEWTVLGGATAVPAPRPGPSPQGSRPVSRQTNSRPGSRMNEFVNSPDVLSAVGDEEEDRDRYFDSRRSDSGRSSPSEASQVIRALRSVASGVSSAASGVGSVLGLRGVEPDNEGEARRSRAMSGSSSGVFSPASPSPPMRSRAHLTTSHSSGSHESPARSFASPTPSRPFSPTQAWKGLTPPSPRSSSSVYVRSPSLSSVGEGAEGVEAEGEFAIKPFDEAQFLADLGFGLGREFEGPGTSTGAGASMGTGTGHGFGFKGQSLAAALSPPLAGPSPVVDNPSPPVAESPSWHPSRLAGSSPPSIPLVRAMSPLLSRESSPLARGSSSSPPMHGFGTSPAGVVRVSSPLARVTIGSSSSGPMPASSSSMPTPVASPSPVLDSSLPSHEAPLAAKPVTKTRVRTRRMGTSASVVGSVMSGAGSESVISGFGGRSVVSGFDGRSAVGESVASWAPEPSVISGAGGHSVISGDGETPIVTAPQSVTSVSNQLAPEVVEEQPVISTVELAESVISNAGDEDEDPKIEVVSVRSGSMVSRPRSEAVAAGGSTQPPVEDYAESASPKDRAKPIIAAPKSFVSEHRIRGKSFSLLSVSSEAPSSIVSPLSPRLVAALQASGIEVAMEEAPFSREQDEEVERVAESLAGMNLRGALPEEEDRIGTIERVDTHSSGFTSPIVPEGAPSAVGSLFSRAASPKPNPFVPRFNLGRAGDPRSSTPTRAPGGSGPAPATPKAVRLVQGLQNTPGSVRSHRSAGPGSSFERPDSAMSAARIPAPASIFSNRSAAHGAAQVPTPASVFSAGPGGTSERRLSVDPAHIPAPGSTFSRGPGSVFSARGKLSGEHRPHQVDSPAAFGSLMGHLQSPVMSQSRSGMSLEPHEAISVERDAPVGKVAGSPGFHTPAGQASPDVDIGENQSRTPANERVTPTSSAFVPPSHEEPARNGGMAGEEAGPEDDLEGGLTSSSEEGARDDDARTATADDDGLDHLTSSIGEPFGLQLDATPGHSPMLEPPAFDPRHANRSRDQRVLTSAPLFESPKHTMMTEPKLPGGFLGEDQPLSASPSLMPPADGTLLEVLDDEDAMPEEVLELNPVICDACSAPMPLAKWTEHISKANHRRNATRYSQYVFRNTTTDRDTSSPSSDPSASRKDPAIDARERWAEATRIQPRPAHPSEYAFCDTCAVFLVRGDNEHFQGKKHLRCLRAAALDDAAELESVRGSVSDEEDGPAAIRAAREAAGITPDWTKPRTRLRKSIGAAQPKLGQMAFQPVGTVEQNGAGEAWPSSNQSASLIPQSVERNQMGWDM